MVPWLHQSLRYAEPVCPENALLLLPGLGLHHRHREVGPVAQQVVRSLRLPAPARRAAGQDDAPVGEGALLADGRGLEADGTFYRFRHC